MRPSRVVVTGGAGFIGSTLVKRLVQQGHHVRVIDNLWQQIPQGTFMLVQEVK